MIRQLPKDVVDRIAAGEVIERPASVVKELVENALDAGARRIEVELEQGGKRLIRVTDDGCGMDEDDLRLAFSPHATSKLTEVDDLLAIASYGFRGEALASIGAVGRARVISRRHDADGGFEVRCEGGAVEAPRPCAAAPGTVVEAQHLFFNVPARARFLKGDASETSRCLEAVLRFALVAEGVAFRVKSGKRVLFEVPANASRRDRLATAFGQELGDAAIEARQSDDGIHVEALLGPPDLAKARPRQQLLFMNGRVVVDNTLRAAVRQAYREFLAPGLSPLFALMITIDPAEVDVNVHPAKTEVRFRDSSRVFRAVYHAVLEALRNADLAPRPGAQSPPRSVSGGVTRVREAAAAAPTPPPLPPLPSSHRRRRDDDGDLASGPVSGGGAAAPERTDAASEPSALPVAVPAVPPRTGAGWIPLFDTYICYQSGEDVVLVDQHALHERILYERFRREVSRGAVASQRLLVPTVVEVGRAAVVRAEDLSGTLADVGMEVTAFSDTELAVHAVPALLGRADPGVLLRAVLDAEDQPAEGAARERLDHRLHDLACRAAVKAGDRLADGEVDALLDEAAALPEAKACPHGRPTSVRLRQGDLERWFKRSGF